MKNFLVEESERIEILKRHKLVVEQQIPESRRKLEAGKDAGCFGKKGTDPYFGVIQTTNGDWVFQKTASNQAMISQGFVLLRIRPDGMYYYTDSKRTKFTTPQPLPTPCPAMINYGKKPENQVNNEYLISQYKNDGYATVDELRAKKIDTRELDNPAVWSMVSVAGVKLYKLKNTNVGGMDDPKNARRISWIKELKDKYGYIVNPTDVEKNELQSRRLYDLNIAGLEPGLFPADQMIWIKSSENKSSENLGQKQESEDISRSGCKDTIERFYNEFLRTRGRQITNFAMLQKLQDQAQFCKNRWEGKWGIGGGKFEDMIKVLSGLTGRGPSSSGDDKVFRLQ